jgi:hypothetical protein
MGSATRTWVAPLSAKAKNLRPFFIVSMSSPDIRQYICVLHYAAAVSSARSLRPQLMNTLIRDLSCLIRQHYYLDASVRSAIIASIDAESSCIVAMDVIRTMIDVTGPLTIVLGH